MANAGSGTVSAPMCYYYEQNEEISAANRVFFYLADPVDALSVGYTRKNNLFCIADPVAALYVNHFLLS